MCALDKAAEGWAFVRGLRRGVGVGEGHPPSPFNPVIFSIQLEDSARCLHILSVPSVLSILTIGGSCPYRSTFSLSAATHWDLASNALMASLIEVCATEEHHTVSQLQCAHPRKYAPAAWAEEAGSSGRAQQREIASDPAVFATGGSDSGRDCCVRGLP